MSRVLVTVKSPLPMTMLLCYGLGLSGNEVTFAIDQVISYELGIGGIEV